MAFNLVVGITATGADQIDKLEQGLDDASAAANRTTQAVKTLGTETTKAAATLKDAGSAASAGIAEASSGLDAHLQKLDAKWAAINKTVLEGGTVPKSYYAYLSDEAKAMIDSLERVNAPVQRYEQELAALDISARKGALSLEQYELALAKVQKQAERGGALAPLQGPAFDPSKAGAGLTEELRREQQILEKINGPMREYQAQVAALDRLLQKGAIDGADYNRELERAGTAATKGLNPVQGPKPPGGAAGAGAAAESAGAGDYVKAIAPQFGQGGQLLSQFASGGVLAAAGAAALVVELGHLSDQYTTLSNKVERFSTTTLTADDILHQQLDLSRELHSSLEATEALYVKVRDSTNQLNLSQREQQQLAKDIGVAVAAEGKSAEEAAALTQRLGIAFETGTINGREMRSLMKQYPEIANELSQALGHTQSQLLQMANKGQISAQQLIDAFHKMEPEAEATLKRLDETFSQKAGHLWDSVKLTVGGALKDYLDAYKSPAEIAEAYAARKLHEHQEAARQLTTEIERNTRTAEIASAGHAIGVDVGPFSKELADKITDVRMTARQAGVDIADAFADAKAKAQLYGTEIDKIREQHAAKEIADDAKRMYDAMYGAGDILTKQMDRWRDIGLQIVTITKAIEHWQVLDAGAPPSRERTELERQKRDLLTEQDKKPFGDEVTKYVQGLDKARDGLEDWRAAAKAGTISQEELRKKTDEFLTTLNDGRLPEAIKFWEEFHLPQQQFARDEAALTSLLHRGSISVVEYTMKLRELREALDKTGFAKILDEEHDAFVKQEVVMQRYLAGHQTMAQDFAVYQAQVAREEKLDALGSAFIEPARVYEQTLLNASDAAKQLGLSQEAIIVLQRQARDQFDSSAEALSKVTVNVAGYQQALNKLIAQRNATPEGEQPWGSASQQFQSSVSQLDREAKLVEQFDQPLANYKRQLADIDGAVKDLGLSQEHTTFLQRKAREEFDAATEALSKQKGPQEAYNATLRKLDDQLARTEISQSRYTDAVAKTKEQLLTDTGNDKTFLGALELQWIKLQQEADRLGATIAGQVLGDVDKLNEGLVSAANNGAVSWSAMADAMIQDLERVALKMLEIKLIGSVVGLFSSGAGGGGGGGLADTSISGVDYGSVPVGGGIGAAPVGLAASDEHLTITLPGAYPYPSPPSPGGAAGGGGGVAPVVHVHNHYDSAISQAALDGPGGQTSVMNTLRLKSGALRNLTSRPKRA